MVGNLEGDNPKFRKKSELSFSGVGLKMIARKSELFYDV